MRCIRTPEGTKSATIGVSRTFLENDVAGLSWVTRRDYHRKSRPGGRKLFAKLRAEVKRKQTTSWANADTVTTNWKRLLTRAVRRSGGGARLDHHFRLRTPRGTGGFAVLGNSTKCAMIFSQHCGKVVHDGRALFSILSIRAAVHHNYRYAIFHSQW